MGDFTFERGELNTITLAVLRLAGTLPDFPDDYTAPKVRVSHINGGNEVEDLAFTNMIQVPGSNRWYHKYTIPANAPFTRYLVTFETDIEGVTTQAYEEFRVVPATEAESGAGEFAVDITVKHAVTNQVIIGADVRVYDKVNPSTILAVTKTDNTGKAVVFLNQGVYLMEIKKTGIISEIHTLTVDALGNHTISGN